MCCWRVSPTFVEGADRAPVPSLVAPAFGSLDIFIRLLLSVVVPFGCLVFPSSLRVLLYPLPMAFSVPTSLMGPSGTAAASLMFVSPFVPEAASAGRCAPFLFCFMAVFLLSLLLLVLSLFF